MRRCDGRNPEELRNIEISRSYLKHAAGSVLISCGDTKVLCAASIEEKVPPFLKGSGQGWITAEYSLLPQSTHRRTSREAARGKLTGRTQEIQRLIGRALRSVVDLSALGERTLWIDCDVIQADGGTRTASITGAFVAMVDALLQRNDQDKPFPVKDFLAATSVGILNDQILLDLCYEEDSQAVVDMNVIMTGSGQFVEVQGTGEEHPFSKDQLQQLLELGEQGIKKLVNLQQELLGPDALKISRGGN